MILFFLFFSICGKYISVERQITKPESSFTISENSIVIHINPVNFPEFSDTYSAREVIRPSSSNLVLKMVKKKHWRWRLSRKQWSKTTQAQRAAHVGSPCYYTKKLLFKYLVFLQRRIAQIQNGWNCYSETLKKQNFLRRIFGKNVSSLQETHVNQTWLDFTRPLCWIGLNWIAVTVSLWWTM